MKKMIAENMMSYLTGKVKYHQANVRIYLQSPVGIGEHGDVLETIEKELNIIAMYHDQIEMLNTYFATPKV